MTVQSLVLWTALSQSYLDYNNRNHTEHSHCVSLFVADSVFLL